MAEVPLLVGRLELYEAQLKTLEGLLAERLAGLAAADALLTIPKVAPVTAAAFLGSLGDPRAYTSAQEVLALAGLTLVERSSGVHQGEKRISKRGRPVVQTGGLFRAEYEALLARNGDKAAPALTAVARRGLRLWFSVARRGTPWTPDAPAPGRRGPSGAADGPA